VEIVWFDTIDSTQRYVIEGLKNHTLVSPVCVGATLQTHGIGSRGNHWIGQEGNLFISLALKREALPHDLPLESSSIYFAMILKELLMELGSQIWLKWPNDFYLEDQKVGGVITAVVGKSLVCGMGLNLQHAVENFGVSDISMMPQTLTPLYLNRLEKYPSWKQIFSKFEIEFERSKSFSTHSIMNTMINLQDAILLTDGSLECNGQRIFSLR
jgi:BirA family biotin operon repressor/biotin-[acetyl-CoA-carboxylase] ligase